MVLNVTFLLSIYNPLYDSPAVSLCVHHSESINKVKFKQENQQRFYKVSESILERRVLRKKVLYVHFNVLS